MINDTLYISDLDGTLLDPTSTVPRETIELLNPLIDKGLMFTVATARTPATVDPLLRDLHPSVNSRMRDIPAIVMTGAAYWNRHLHRYDYIQTLSPYDTDIILKEFGKAGISPFDYRLAADETLNVYHSARMTPREDAFYQERRHLTLKHFHLGAKPRDEEPTVLMFAMGDPEKIDAVARKISARTECAAAWYRDIFNPDLALMDVYAPGVSKAEAVRDVATELGARRTVVFGDNLNDIPMMKVATLAVAMENALPAVKEAADIVIGPNTRPSVAEFILHDIANH